jgi:hypothetical protein
VNSQLNGGEVGGGVGFEGGRAVEKEDGKTLNKELGDGGREW